MEFKAFKYLYENRRTIPDSFDQVYYSPMTKFVVYYACSLIVNDDGTYSLKGPDEGLKKWLDEMLKKYKNRLDIIYSEKVGNTIYQMSKFVTFSDPKFPYAFDEAVSTYGITKKHFYSGDDSFRKVNSIADIRRLDAELEAFEEQGIARRRARRAEKEKGNTQEGN